MSIHDLGGKAVLDPYVLVTYTDGFGEIPREVEAFLEMNHEGLIGVSASGNRNWGRNFAISADMIAAKYHVPVLLKFELSGTRRDVEKFIEGVRRLYDAYRIKPKDEPYVQSGRPF